MLFRFAWRNVWRNRNRSLITMSAIGSAVVLAVVTMSLQKGVFDHLVRNMVSLYTGYIQVHGKGYWDEQTLDNSFEINDTVDRLIRQTPGISQASYRLETFALASSGEKTTGCLVVGIEPEAEHRLTDLRAKIRTGAMFAPDGNTVLLGEGLAEKLGMHTGDTLILLSQGYFGNTAAMKAAVGATLHFGAPNLNNRIAYLSLPQAQRWLDADGRATSLVLGLRNTGALPLVSSSLKQHLPGAFEALTWEEMMPEIAQHIAVDTASMYVIIGVLYLLISFGIYSTLLMMLAERRREFGMLTALGMRPVLLSRLVLAETIFLTFCGCLIGLVLSWPIVWYLAEYPIRLGGQTAEAYERFGFEPVYPAVVSVRIFLEQTLIVLVMGLLLALYPVWRVLHIDPVKSMRT